MHILSFAVMLLFSGISPALADDSGYIISIQFENDFFGGGTDRHFTHGTRIECLTEPISWITSAADKLPWFSSDRAKEHPGDPFQARAGCMRVSAWWPTRGRTATTNWNWK